VPWTPDSPDQTKVRIARANLNDRSVEGMEHLELSVFSVRFHPEASPGPHDSRHLFAHFIRMMDEAKAKSHS
jgi:carbamoyl-phosphate synthase small subunit